MSGWKLPRIPLNTKITIIPFSGLLFYSRKTEKKNHAKTIEEQFDIKWKDAHYIFFIPVLPTLVDDFTIPPIQPNLLSPQSRHTAGLNFPASSSVTCGHWDGSGHDMWPQNSHFPQPPSGRIHISASGWTEWKRSSGKLGKLHMDCGGFKNTSANSSTHCPSSLDCLF